MVFDSNIICLYNGVWLQSWSSKLALLEVGLLWGWWKSSQVSHHASSSIRIMMITTQASILARTRECGAGLASLREAHINILGNIRWFTVGNNILSWWYMYAKMKMFFFKINFAFVLTLTMNSSRNEEDQLQKRGSESSEERRDQEVRVIVSQKKIFSVTEVTWR